ncbi:MAG: DUF2062 domain-containing protein [Ectothiorhodospiraceae bacterium]|nr:DUF2062 domain-containing protein [Ectothiorhodospiraceae bacterium]
MPRKFLRRYLPSSASVRAHPRLRVLGVLLHDPNLWHLNRHTVAGGVALGLFIAFIPMPMQMLVAAAFAIPLRVNLPIAVAMVWVSNPLTMPPMFFFSYRIGTWFIGSPVRDRGFEPSLEWFWYELGNIWQPLYLGSIICGGLVGLAGYGLVHMIWRLHIRSHLRRRRARRRPAE